MENDYSSISLPFFILFDSKVVMGESVYYIYSLCSYPQITIIEKRRIHGINYSPIHV